MSTWKDGYHIHFWKQKNHFFSFSVHVEVARSVTVAALIVFYQQKKEIEVGYKIKIQTQNT